MITLNSTKELLNYIASNNLMVFDYVTFYGYLEANYLWQNDNIEKQILKFNPDFIKMMEHYFIQEVIEPDMEYYDQFWVTPMMEKNQLHYKLKKFISTNTLEEHEPEGEDFLINYIEQILPKINAIMDRKDINKQNFNEFVKYSCSNGGSVLDIYDLSTNRWLADTDFKFGDKVSDLLWQLYDTKIVNSFAISEKVSISENRISYYTPEQCDGGEIISKETTNLFDYGIVYKI